MGKNFFQKIAYYASFLGILGYFLSIFILKSDSLGLGLLVAAIFYDVTVLLCYMYGLDNSKTLAVIGVVAVICLLRLAIYLFIGGEVIEISSGRMHINWYAIIPYLLRPR